MARARFPDTTTDLISDSGNLLWSFAQGEQLEFPITLNFIEDITVVGYVYEAAIVEGLNVPDQTSAPDDIRSGGVTDALVVRVPTLIGTWDPAVAYNKEEIVLAGSVYYKLLGGASRVEATAPASDPLWEVTSLSKIYVQFDAAIAATWAVQPSVSNPAYGFFELRVTEPTDAVFTRTWKPVRGVVELLFSPTHVTADP
jgi:hypothetical protein